MRPWLLCVGLAVGCGDPLVGEAYRGEPVEALPLEVSSSDDPTNYDGVPVRVALFWSPGGPYSEVDTWVEQPQTSRAAQPLDRFDLMVFERPTAELLVGGTGYGLARALAYRDDDGDGRKGAAEAVVGINGRSALVYAPADTTGPSGNPLPAGFHIVAAPVPCDPEPAPIGIVQADNCGVPIGDSCRTEVPSGPGMMMAPEDPCGDQGTCLGNAQGGYCAVEVQTQLGPNGCVPADGRTTVVEGEDGPVPYFLKACDADADCRVGQGYRCDHWRGVCLPGERLTVVLGETEFERLCQPSMMRMGPGGMMRPGAGAPPAP